MLTTTTLLTLLTLLQKFRDIDTDNNGTIDSKVRFFWLHLPVEVQFLLYFSLFCVPV